MLAEADAGILFNAPQQVIDEFPQFPAVHNYEDLKREFIWASDRDLKVWHNMFMGCWSVRIDITEGQKSDAGKNIE